jgi:hypothetical protein
MAIFQRILEQHERLQARAEWTDQAYQVARNAFSASPILRGRSIGVFAAGSMGRREMGGHSDLDLFPICTRASRHSKFLEKCQIIGELVRLNKDLGYPSFSNDGRFLKLYHLDDMTQKMGLPIDDSENHFTARMLMLLEGRPLLNDAVNRRVREEVVAQYFRDKRGKRSYKPLFLLNDILRYWRTLCLNYEAIRHDPNRPWRKKNVNLKFSRMLTVFGTVLPMVSEPVITAPNFMRLLEQSPIERLAEGLGVLRDRHLARGFPRFLDTYEAFLEWKDNDEVEGRMTTSRRKTEIRRAAEFFSAYLYEALTHKKIDAEFRRYLLI